MPIVVALLAAGLALLASAGSGETPAPPDGKTPPAGKTAKPPKAARKMSSQDAFEAGKKARDAELILETKERETREAEIDAAVAKRVKATPPPKSDPPPPKE